MRKTYKYRLYPTKAQAEALTGQLSEACRLYNAALQERIEAYARHRKSINYYDQAAQLTEIRATGDFGLPNHFVVFSTEDDHGGGYCLLRRAAVQKSRRR